jgi:hypothetical protein
MKTNKWKTHGEIPGEKNPGIKAPKKKKPKSDLTLGFVDSSDYIRTLACQSQRTETIYRMRQSALSNQRANLRSLHGSMIPIKSQKAIKKLAEDPTNAHAIPSPSPSPSPDNSPRKGLRLRRTFTSGSFKKMCSSLAGQTGVRGETKPNFQRTTLEPKSTKSQFCPTPQPQASDNDQLSFWDSSEEGENQLPKLDSLDNDDQEMKSQKSNRTVEEVSDGDDRESDGGQEMKSIDEESEDDANED